MGSKGKALVKQYIIKKKRWWVMVYEEDLWWCVCLNNRNGNLFQISEYKHKSNALKLAKSIAESAGWEVRER